MPSSLAAVVRRRRVALRRWDEGEPVQRACEVIGCSRASLFRWKARFDEGGIAALLDRYRSTRVSELPPEVERVVLTVRMLTYWNSHRIAAEFRRREIWPLSHAQVDRLFARLGAYPDRATNASGPTIFGTSTSKVRSTCAAGAGGAAATSSPRR